MPKLIKANKKIFVKKQLFWMVLLASGLIIFGIGILILLVKSDPNPSPGAEYSAIPIKVDYPAPQISLKDLMSKDASLDEYRNKVILVNNWATWCPPCKAEMPTLQKYFQSHADQGFLVIAIESGESIDEVSDFVKQNSITFPVWIDINGLALEKFNNWDLPSSYVIDRSGRVKLTWTGPISMEMLEKYVTPLVDK